MDMWQGLGARFAWLVVAPTALAAVPAWLFLGDPGGPELSYGLVVAIPLLGLVPVIVYRWLTRERVILVPYLAGASVSVFLVALGVEGFASAIFDQPGSEFFLMFLIPCLSLAQPLLTLAGGVGSFLSLSGRTRPAPASR